ncbi:uncharacterized protein TM35_000173300 [Trypanosoma theileri]|uniref:Uncharacterized protein n=1 Tax=Trypanosoma theileri TaxID=67003 RepID=A0A1X0NV82_9TRYP|nr:uncharacterized protein TM35_000173300 [Trypanosoma theileri]ORC88458.1 hypothetical protein TM35_000173300 [Trypanosoma theileri]
MHFARRSTHTRREKKKDSIQTVETILCQYSVTPHPRSFPYLKEALCPSSNFKVGVSGAHLFPINKTKKKKRENLFVPTRPLHTWGFARTIALPSKPAPWVTLFICGEGITV